MPGGEFELDDHKSLLRPPPLSTGLDLESQGPDLLGTSAGGTGSPASGKKSGIGDLLRHLDRGLSNRNLSRRNVDQSGLSPRSDGRSHDALGDGAPPEWALLLIGCLLGLATGICVAAFNRGVST